MAIPFPAIFYQKICTVDQYYSHQVHTERIPHLRCPPSANRANTLQIHNIISAGFIPINGKVYSPIIFSQQKNFHNLCLFPLIFPKNIPYLIEELNNLIRQSVLSPRLFEFGFIPKKLSSRPE